jgi:CBS domain-containing protein
MTIAKIMRTDVVALGAEERIETAWRQMRDHRLAALPVADTTGRLVGVLTEQALLRRLTPRRTPPWWEQILPEKDRLASEYLKSVGLTVADLMTRAPLSIVPDASVEAAAGLMRRHEIDVLPVVASDVCVGLVTRPDILDHLSWPTTAAPGAVTDVELERVMQETLDQEPWSPRQRVTAEAAQGVIRLTGILTSPVERSAVVAMARAVPGCAGVEDRLRVVVRRKKEQGLITGAPRSRDPRRRA